VALTETGKHRHIHIAIAIAIQALPCCHLSIPIIIFLSRSSSHIVVVAPSSWALHAFADKTP